MPKIIPFLLFAASAFAQVVPAVNSFTYSGGSLNWSITGSAAQSIDQSIGSVGASGSVPVNPSTTTVYTLRAATASTRGYYSQASVVVKPGSADLSGVTLTTSANLTDPTKGTFGPGCSGSVLQYGACQITVCPSSIAGIANVNYGDFTVVFTGQATGSTYTIHGYHEVFGTGHCWKWNFQPPSAETWNWSLTLAPIGLRSYYTSSGSFTSVASTLSGFIRSYGPSAPTQFKTDNGNPFYPIGQDVAAVNNNGGNDLSFNIPLDIGFNLAENGRNRAGALAEKGFNLMVMEGGQGIRSFINQSAGNNTYYTGNSLTAVFPMTFDKLCYDALMTGVHLQVAPFDNPYAFLPSYDPSSNLDTSQAFFEAWQWVVNRWGYCTDIWQYQTEDGGGTGPQSKPNFKFYYQSIGAYLASNDPYGHLRTTSFPAVCATCTWTSEPTPFPIDLISTSVYCSDRQSPSLTLANSIVMGSCADGHGISTYQGLMPNIPFLWSEGGTTGSPPYDSDPGYWERTRILQWVAAANGVHTTLWPGSGCTGLGAVGAGAQCVGEQQYWQTAILSSFLSSLDPVMSGLPTTVSSCAGGQSLKSYARSGSAGAWGYIVNTTNRSSCENAKLTASLPAAGTIVWYQPSDGVQIASSSVSGGSQSVTIPAFSADNFHGDIVWRWFPTTNPVVTTAMPLGVLIGNSCNQTLTAAGGASPYEWKVTGGMLPPGCSLNASTGSITGTTTASGYFSVQIGVVDANGLASAPQLLRISVFPMLSFPWSTLLQSENAPFGVGAFAVSGGMPPLTAAIGGDLPAGCSTNGYGIGACTPTSAGTYTLTLTVTDGLSNQASQVETMNVNVSTLSISDAGPAFPGATLGSYYSGGIEQIFAVRGGSNNYSVSVTSGSLPAGLTASIQNARAIFITGTPTSPGSSTATLTISDTNKNTTTLPVTITVAPAVGISANGPPPIQPDEPYVFALTPANGTAPFAWFIYPGSSLPPGLTLAPSGYLAGVPSAPGPYSFTVGVMDANGSVATESISLSGGSGSVGPGSGGSGKTQLQPRPRQTRDRKSRSAAPVGR